MGQHRAGSPIDDISYLARSEHRIPTLIALTDCARSRSALCEMTGVSSSTIRRTLNEFEDRNWVSKEANQYEATQLGEIIASGVEDLIERVESERKLRDVWHWLPDEESGFTVEMCSGAVVTVADSDEPYRPVNRFLSLAQQTDRYRFIGCNMASLDPCEEELGRLVREGMQMEFIDSLSVIERRRSTDSALFSEKTDCENLTAWVHEDLPLRGIGLFDDRVLVSGYDSDSGEVRVLLDTENSEAREWAESKFASYKDEARPLTFEPAIE